MNLSYNSFLARYYRWAIDDKLPPDICTLFWHMLFSVLTLPVSLPGYIPLFRSECWDYETIFGKVWGGVKLWIAFFLFGALGAAAINKQWWPGILDLPLLLACLIGFLLITTLGITLIALVATICWALNELYKTLKRRWEKKDKFYDDIPEIEPPPSWIKQTWAAIRGKYCTKITWR